MYNARNRYEEYCMPIIVVPVTYSNNVPGTDYSLGADTALNQVVKVICVLRIMVDHIYRKTLEKF